MLLFIFLDFSGCFCVSVPTTSKVSRSEHRQKMMGASCQGILQLHEILSCQEENMTLTRPEQKNKVKVLISCWQNCYYRTARHQNRLYIFCSRYKWHSWWPGEQKVHNTEQPLASAAIQSLTNSKLFRVLYLQLLGFTRKHLQSFTFKSFPGGLKIHSTKANTKICHSQICNNTS